MAVVGITIGISFLFAVVAGPILSGTIGVPGIFWLMAGLGFLGIAVTQWIVPNPARIRTHRDAETVPGMLGSVVRNRELLRLDFGIFALHAVLTSSFLVVPQILERSLSITNDRQWIIYLPVMVVSFLFMVPAVVIAEKYRRMKPVLVGSIALLTASQLVFFFGAAGSAILVVAAMTAFFVAFNIIEATLPSIVTKTAPPDAKGTATGVYSSSQFLGIFIGGTTGGLVNQSGGAASLFLLTMGIALVWLLVAATMSKPGHYTTRVIHIGAAKAVDTALLLKRFRQIPGVVDATIVASEELAYLKVDPKLFDRTSIEHLAAACEPSGA
jgi:predicted MFS family arabinose efflux permease